MFLMENLNTVLIIDEDIELMSSAANILDSDPSVEKVLKAATPESAESEIVIHSPDFIIADLGFSVIDRILQQSKCSNNLPFILMTSWYDNEDYLKLSRSMGANAYCLKENLEIALVDLLDYLQKGINPSILRSRYYLLK
jgi:DNA-binding NarL/FixJ family response regulator